MTLSEVNSILETALFRLSEATKHVEGDKWELDGKQGIWRTVRGRRMFFPDDGSDPVGMPSAMKLAPAKKLMKTAKGGGEGAGGDLGTETAQKAVSGAREELDDAVGGSGESAIEELENGSEEEQEALDKFDRGGSLGGKDRKTLARGGVQAALGLGLGAAIMGALPTLLAFATMYLVATYAVDKVAKKLGEIFESKTSRRKRLATAIEGGIKETLADISRGRVDKKALAKAQAFAARKAKGGKRGVSLP